MFVLCNNYEYEIVGKVILDDSLERLTMLIEHVRFDLDVELERLWRKFKLAIEQAKSIWQQHIAVFMSADYDFGLVDVERICTHHNLKLDFAGLDDGDGAWLTADGTYYLERRDTDEVSYRMAEAQVLAGWILMQGKQTVSNIAVQVLAAEILMPSADLARLLAKYDGELLVLEVCKTFAVSVAMAKFGVAMAQMK